MRLFDLSNGIKPTQQLLYISPFDEIWNRDESEGKSKAIKDFVFIYYMASPSRDNPYSQLDEKERKKFILEQVSILRGYKPDELVNKAIEQYKKLLNQSTSYRLYIAMKTAVDSIIRMITEIDESDCSSILKVSDLTRATKDLSTLIEKLNELQTIVSKENDSGAIYGAENINPFEQ